MKSVIAKQLIKWFLFVLYWTMFIIGTVQFFNFANEPVGHNLPFFILAAIALCAVVGGPIYTLETENCLFIFSPKLPKPVYHDSGIYYIKSSIYCRFSNFNNFILYEDRIWYLKKIEEYYNITNTEDLKHRIQYSLDKYHKKTQDKIRKKKIIDDWDGDVYSSKSIARQEKLKRII